MFWQINKFTQFTEQAKQVYSEVAPTFGNGAYFQESVIGTAALTGKILGLGVAENCVSNALNEYSIIQ